MRYMSYVKNVGFMGCSDSTLQEENVQQEYSETIAGNSKLEKLLNSKRPDDLLVAFVYLDKGISEAENDSPSAIYGEALSRQQQIKSHLQSALEDKNQNELFSEKLSMYDLFVDLKIRNARAAVEHEEFIARINRRDLNDNAIRIWQNAFRILEDLITKSAKKISDLRNAYQLQEDLLSKVFGKSFGSETEKLLEQELDRMRYYRDMLRIGVLQWEACINRISTAVRLSRDGVSAWKLVKNQNLEHKIKYATIARDCLQEAIILIQTSEELLQDVQFPFCTTRELKGVAQAIEYIFTDVLIDDRYSHATAVYSNLVQRATLLDEWMKEVLQTKLRKDYAETDGKIIHLAKQLKNERIDLIKKKLGLQSPIPEVEELQMSESVLPTTTIVNSYSNLQMNPTPSEDLLKFPINIESKLRLSSSMRPNKTEDVKTYFENLMAEKRNTMWPSRSIDQLQNMTAHQ